MKTLLSSLACCAIIACTTAFVSTPATSFAADGNKPSHDKVADHITVKEGKLFIVKGTDKQALQEDVTLADGSKVTKDGNHVSKDGVRTPLQEGDSVSLDGGAISKAGSKDAPAADKEPAKEGGNKSGQNTDNK